MTRKSHDGCELSHVRICAQYWTPHTRTCSLSLVCRFPDFRNPSVILSIFVVELRGKRELTDGRGGGALWKSERFHRGDAAAEWYRAGLVELVALLRALKRQIVRRWSQIHARVLLVHSALLRLRGRSCTSRRLSFCVVAACAET